MSRAKSEISALHNTKLSLSIQAKQVAVKSLKQRTASSKQKIQIALPKQASLLKHVALSYAVAECI